MACGHLTAWAALDRGPHVETPHKPKLYCGPNIRRTPVFLVGRYFFGLLLGFFFLVNPNIKIIRNGNEEVELPLADSVEHLLLSSHAM